MSRQTVGSPAAMRVKSRKPGPASDRNSRPAGCEITALKYAKASRCGRWLTAAKAASWFSGVMRSTWQPIAAQTSVAFCTMTGSVCASGVRMTCLPW